MNEHSDDIVVLGSGPAGVATALGLTKLGYAVRVISSPRSYRACEGLSERAVAGLRNAGCHSGATILPEATPRYVCWNGAANRANRERLALREGFDQALLEDLHNAGIEYLQGRVQRLEAGAGTISSVTFTASDRTTTDVKATFIVDARGRTAPGGGADRLRGPETVSLLQHWRGKPVEAKSMAASFSDGWAWLAMTADGQRFTQITVAADAPDFPKKSALREYFLQHLKSIPEAAEFHRNATPVGELVARSSTGVLHQNPLQNRVMRVGDAALATDPLSGNGIFSALSTALIAPSVINTLLRAPEHAALAQQFYNDRVQHAFERFSRIGRDFYAMEQRWPDNPFWRTRAAWPDCEPAHGDLATTVIEITQKPVVENNLIRPREVVITSDQPLGVWHVGGIELAPIVRQLSESPRHYLEGWEKDLPSLVNVDRRQLAALTVWLNQYGLLDRPKS